MYHEDHKINDLVLTIINDGNGDQCGMTYAQRCAAAANGIGEYLAACRAYDRYAFKHYETPRAERWQLMVAAELLQKYYRDHLAEG